MKRLLSMLLVLATLLCLLPVAVTASEETTLENRSAATYIDLYVKDGLVALFDAYGATAADGNVASWTPVDLYGKAGYDAYVDPTTYATSLNGSWAYADKGARNTGNGHLNLDALGAIIGTSYSIQEVSSYPHLGTANVVDGVLQNRDDLKTCGTYFTSMAGGFHYGYLVTNLASASSANSKNFLQVIDEQIWWNTQPGKMTSYITHTYLTTPEYNTRHFLTLTDTKGGSYENILVGAPVAVERTIFRAHPVAGKAVDGVTPYTSLYKMHIQFPMEVRDNPTPMCDWSVTISKTTAEADHKQTWLRVGNGGATMHAIRIYNKELTKAEYDRNHLADLCGYYGIDVNDVVALEAADLAALAAEAREIKITLVADEAADLKETLEAIIAEYGPDEGEGGEVGGDGTLDPNYLDLYVKDGLVALFDAYAAKAEDGAASHWTAVDLHGKTGYNAYLAPSAYTATLSGTWTYCDKGIKMNGNTSLNLDSLGALIGTSYSVQEVIGYPDVAEPSISKNVISSIPASLGTYFTSSLGSFKYGLLRRNQATELTGYSKNFLGIFHEKFGWGASGSYLTHTYYTTEAYNTRVYETLFDADGNDYSGRIVGGPLALERTIFRAHPVAGKAVDGVVPYTTTYKIHTQLPLEYRNETGAKADWSTVISKTAAEADHKSTALRFGHGDATAYSFRVYNKELTVAEINQNHFADLVAYYNIELTPNILDLPAASLAMLGAALSDTTLDAKLGSKAYRETRTVIANTISEAAPSLIDMANSVVSVEGVTYRVSGDYGVRAVFSVNANAVQGLLDAGYTVSYGAVLALKSENTAKIEVALDKNGKVVLAEGLKGVLTANDQNGFKYLTEDKRGFGAAVTFKADGSDADHYNDELVFVGFTTISLDGVECLTVYDNVAVDGINALSLTSVHQHALKSTTDKGLKARLEEILK